MAFRFSAGDDAALPITHEINVTPFIDVMLVLLIIFMVAAPLATVDVKVDLPVSTARPAPQPATPVYVTIRADGAMLVNDRAVAPEAVGAMVRDLAGPARADGPRIYLRADRKVAYERLMEAMNALRGAGYLQVALVGVKGDATP